MRSTNVVIIPNPQTISHPGRRACILLHNCTPLEFSDGALPQSLCGGTSLTRKRTPIGPCRRPMPSVLGGSWGGGRFLKNVLEFKNVLPTVFRMGAPYERGTYVQGYLSHSRKVDIRLTGKGNSNSHGARPVHLITSMIKWIRTSGLSIKNSLCVQGYLSH